MHLYNKSIPINLEIIDESNISDFLDDIVQIFESCDLKPLEEKNIQCFESAGILYNRKLASSSNGGITSNCTSSPDNLQYFENDSCAYLAANYRNDHLEIGMQMNNDTLASTNIQEHNKQPERPKKQ